MPSLPSLSNIDKTLENNLHSNNPSEHDQKEIKAKEYSNTKDQSLLTGQRYRTAVAADNDDDTSCSSSVTTGSHITNPGLWKYSRTRKVAFWYVFCEIGA